MAKILGPRYREAKLQRSLAKLKKEGSHLVAGRILEDEGRLAGIVTKADIQSKLGPFPLSWRRLKLHVTDVMTPEPFSVGPDEPLNRVAELMLAHKISGVPVVVEGGKIVGIVTESDVFRAFCEALGILEGAGSGRRASAAPEQPD